MATCRRYNVGEVVNTPGFGNCLNNDDGIVSVS